MPFSPQTKTEMFVRCGRLCCLCLKQCGVNIEAAHIIDESKGGPNDADNGIPLCFDCHQEIGGYRDDHPKGNKIRPEELRQRRDRVYNYVETGVIYAQVMAQRSRSASSGSDAKLPENENIERPSAESEKFLQALLTEVPRSNNLASKLSLLNSLAQAYVLGQLQKHALESPVAMSALARVVRDKRFPQDQARLLLEQLMRAITLFGSVEAKASFLTEFQDSGLVEQTDEGLRDAFFEDLIAIMRSDQFAEVNVLVPRLVRHVEAIPKALYPGYFQALLDQSQSLSYQGAPAARRALHELPTAVALAGLESLTLKEISYYLSNEYLKHVVSQNLAAKSVKEKPYLGDLVSIKGTEFIKKYFPDDVL